MDNAIYYYAGIIIGQGPSVPIKTSTYAHLRIWARLQARFVLREKYKSRIPSLISLFTIYIKIGVRMRETI